MSNESVKSYPRMSCLLMMKNIDSQVACLQEERNRIEAKAIREGLYVDWKSLQEAYRRVMKNG